MSNLINWDNLKSYNDSKTKSFEELCFQIAFEEYSNLGLFNSVDDSGGGDGIEFYLEFQNGDIWGWQCKFFGRFSESGRKEQIKKSLQRAYEIHGDKLKKWFLCSKLSLTPQEYKWFENIKTDYHKKKRVLPDSSDVKLEHWGDSSISFFLQKNSKIHRFFFAEKILDIQWFKQKFKLVENSSVIKSKYLDVLHVEGDVDQKIAQLLLNQNYIDYIIENEESLNIIKFEQLYKDSIAMINEQNEWYGFDTIADFMKGFVLTDENVNIIKEGNQYLKEVKKLIDTEDRPRLEKNILEIQKYIEKYNLFYNRYSELKESEITQKINWESEKEEEDELKKLNIKKCRDILFGPYFLLRNYDYYLNIFQNLNNFNECELHIAGAASKGKTHVAVNIVRKQIEKSKPAIFLFGSDFKTSQPFKEQLRSLVDIPADWTVNDFLGALDICGRVYKTKAIIVIDGLNESIHWKEIWKSATENFVNEIKEEFKNILLITTYRASYEDMLFPKKYFLSERWKAKIEIDGYTNYNVKKAINTYFKYYEIKLAYHSEAIKHFSEPLYLKIFCEAKRGLEVSFQNEDLFDVLEEYLLKCNENILLNLRQEIRYGKKYTHNILNQISEDLWINSSRIIPFCNAIPKILNEEELLVFEGENLLMYRDWKDEEVIAFTYDLLNGYLIAKTLTEKLLTNNDLSLFLESDKFQKELLNENTNHPLYADILRSFWILTIKKFGLKFCSKIDGIHLDYLLYSLFEVNQNVIIDDSLIAKNIIRQVFENSKKRTKLYYLFENTKLDSNHPLNIDLLSELLETLSPGERDLTWTEFIRTEFETGKNFQNYIKDFEKVCKRQVIVSAKIHLAAKNIMWFLTTSHRYMRDISSRALYFYGRRFPLEYMELVEYSLKINDPYIWERTLGGLYGVILAEHNNFHSSFKKKILPEIALKIYSLLFIENAPFATTHILARDYARRSVEIALMYYPSLLTEKQVEEIRPPYKRGGIRSWGEFFYSRKPALFTDPIYMDFSNYTIGSIVKDGHSYSDPPEKKKVRRQIYWRIFDLGWKEETHKEVDSRIENWSYHDRGEKSKVERYGKKYSWIAFFEVAGFREDNNLLDNEWGDFRLSEADIDVSFPRKIKNKKYVKDDFLGNRDVTLMEWYLNGGLPNIKPYLKVKNLQNNLGDWICVDGYVCQEKKKINRQRFTFARALIIKKNRKDEVLNNLKEQNLGGRWLPEINTNADCFASESYLFDEATYSNYKTLSFLKGKKKVKIYKGDSDYIPTFNMDNFEQEFPDFIINEIKEMQDYEALLPVMGYNWGRESEINKTGHPEILSKEIVKQLQLINSAQTFDLYDLDGKIATQSLRYSKNFNNSHHFVYLRKDLLDQFLKESDCTLIWAIWGERSLAFEDMHERKAFFKENGIKDFQVFKDIIEYDISD